MGDWDWYFRPEFIQSLKGSMPNWTLFGPLVPEAADEVGEMLSTVVEGAIRGAFTLCAAPVALWGKAIGGLVDG